MDDAKYIKAIARNFNEIANAIQKRQVLVTVEEYAKKNGRIFFYGASFFDLAVKALFNDVMAHLIKVLDANKDSATFWYVFQNGQNQIVALRSYSKEKISFLQDLSEKVKHVRDKTHFHIDKEGVINPEVIWEEAGISGNDLGRGLEYLFDVLLELKNLIRKENMTKDNYFYDGCDVAKLLDLAKKEGLIDVHHQSEDRILN